MSTPRNTTGLCSRPTRRRGLPWHLAGVAFVALVAGWSCSPNVKPFGVDGAAPEALDAGSGGIPRLPIMNGEGGAGALGGGSKTGRSATGGSGGTVVPIGVGEGGQGRPGTTAGMGGAISSAGTSGAAAGAGGTGRGDDGTGGAYQMGGGLIDGGSSDAPSSGDGPSAGGGAGGSSVAPDGGDKGDKDDKGHKLPAHCDNGKRDVDETDVDCGGKCWLCELGQSCFLNTDCASNFCFLATCKESPLPISL